jgi:hypothetical protein
MNQSREDRECSFNVATSGELRKWIFVAFVFPAHSKKTKNPIPKRQSLAQSIMLTNRYSEGGEKLFPSFGNVESGPFL